MALKPGNGLHAWEIAVTKKLVGESRRRSRSLYREEFDDLMHACLLRWLEVRPKAVPDPDGSTMAFLATVVRNKLIDLARNRGAGKRRSEQEAVSLDEPVGEAGDSLTFADLVDAEQGREPGDYERFDPIDIQIDVADVIRRLTPEQQRLCELLGAQGLSIKAAAEKLRIPRATLYEEIKRIRAIFARHGLDEYLRP